VTIALSKEADTSTMLGSPVRMAYKKKCTFWTVFDLLNYSKRHEK
jgi:hypothetical protein